MSQEDIKVKAYEKERLEFVQLIAANPNYFGTLAAGDFEAVVPIQGNTFYEELSCVAYNPELDQLEATIQVKRPFGYGGDLCTNGSREYVRFYVDYGSGWQDVGVASFNAHDIPDDKDCEGERNKPLSYVVRHPLDPEREYCDRPVLPQVRAILSWQVAPPPGTPNWPQVWGNTLNRRIQIKPKWKPPFVVGITDLVAESVKVQLDPLPLASLAERYSGNGEAERVEPSRFAFEHIHDVLSPGFSPDLVASAAKQLAEVGIDWAGTLAELDDGKGNVSYEELTCLGIDRNADMLVASFVIKRQSGYSGDLCERGSLEWVSFWVDWDDQCEWKHLGTTNLRVHDIERRRPEDLHYWVGVKADLSEFQDDCKEPKVGRIRAVLSWNSKPSETDPEEIPYWGNRLDRHVEIKPRDENGAKGEIDIIGGVSIIQIDTVGGGRTVPNAVFAEWGSPTDPYLPARTCPFGGRVNVQADVPAGYAATGRQYRLLRRQAPSLVNPTPAEIPVTDKFQIASGVALPVWRFPDPVTGWIDYVDPSQNVFNMLGWWEAGGLGVGLYELRLEMATSGGAPLGATPWLRIDLDNTKPEASIEIDSGGDCKDFTKGVTIEGHFVARDVNFGHFTLDTTPNSLGPPDPVTATPIWQQTAAAPGDEWDLVTSTMDPCGYVVTVRVYDRTIVGSRPGIHNHAADDTGFCLRAKPE